LTAQSGFSNGDVRVVVEPTLEQGVWKWKIETFHLSDSNATWKEISVYPVRAWGFAKSEEEAHEAGQKAVEEYYKGLRTKKWFKKYLKQNTSIKNYSKKDYVTEWTENEQS